MKNKKTPKVVSFREAKNEIKRLKTKLVGRCLVSKEIERLIEMQKVTRRFYFFCFVGVSIVLVLFLVSYFLIYK